MDGHAHVRAAASKAREKLEVDPASRQRRFLHPVSGVSILGLDWLLFGSNALSGFGLTVLVCVLGFVCGATAIAWVQRRLAKDSPRSSLLKGLLAGLVVGLPFPVTGTAIGGLVLAASGVRWLRRPRLRDAGKVVDFAREVHAAATREGPVENRPGDET